MKMEYIQHFVKIMANPNVSNFKTQHLNQLLRISPKLPISSQVQ